MHLSIDQRVELCYHTQGRGFDVEKFCHVCKIQQSFPQLEEEGDISKRSRHSMHSIDINKGI